MSFVEQDYLERNPDVAGAVARGEYASAWAHFQLYGRLEGRTHGDPAMSRKEKALYGLHRTGLGLEIGPSHNPIAPKREGFDVHILDHLDAEALRAKYAHHAALGVAIDNIEPVDFVWHGLPLTQTVGAEACYDWIIASHVIEHVPDLISFLRQCEALLKPSGRLSLIVPDKRYCFDCLNPPSSSGELLDAYAAARTRPSPGKVFDHFSNACMRDEMIAWHSQAAGPLRLIHPAAQTRDLWGRSNSSEEYIDVHCWRFTPGSFHLVLSDLQALGLTSLAVVSQFPTAGCEFFMSLGKVAAAAHQPLERLAALEVIRQEGFPQIAADVRPY